MQDSVPSDSNIAFDYFLCVKKGQMIHSAFKGEDSDGEDEALWAQMSEDSEEVDKDS
jgi:hypothetical protein